LEKKLEMAIAHEWITSRAGSEKVFEQMARTFPAADLYALSHSAGAEIATNGRPIRTTMMDSPYWSDRRNVTVPLMPLAWRLLKTPNYETVLTSHHAFAKEFGRKRSRRHFCYVHTPARYVWSPELDPRGGSRLPRLLAPALKAIDRSSVAAVTSFATNSAEVSTRVAKYWGRSSRVIHPPVDTEFFIPDKQVERQDYILSAGRFVEYKRHDLAILLGEATGRPVVLAGDGPLFDKLQALASAARVRVTIHRAPSDALLRSLYREAAFLSFLAHEDFGIVPVEAQACGTPVLGLKAGGTRETVSDGLTGVLVDNLALASLINAAHLIGQISESDCRQWAEKFSPEAFDTALRIWIAEEA
jgi:glycosyltransferase involved in cell wall biosynthesis